MNSVTPTFRGLVRTRADLLVLVEACLQGGLPHTARKPYPEELESLIDAGNTFIYEKDASGFQDWNDHLPWKLVKGGGGVEVFMCIPLVLRKITARVEWQEITHYVVSYQPTHSFGEDELQSLWDCRSTRDLTPRNGLCIQHSLSEERNDENVNS